MRVSNPGLLVGMTILAASLTIRVADADTRIFSVQTDNPSVSITSVRRDGEALPEVGQSGARTFFEINAGDATVACSNQLAFTASNGQQIEYIVDLCAHNWQITLPLGTASTVPTPSPSSPSEAPTSLTIYTDDPNASIDEVRFDKQPLTVASRQGNAVAVNLTPAQRAKCEHDVGLALADGRRIARLVDICTPNGSIVVALNDESASPTAPPPPISGSPAVPSPVVPPVAAPPPTSGEILVVEDLNWESAFEGQRATLSYALPNSDQVEFSASCNRGSKQAEVSLGRSAPEVQPGASVEVVFTGGTYSGTYTATGSDIIALTGVSQPEMTIPTDDAFWTALIREEFLVAHIGSALPYALSLKGSSAAGRPFIEACNSLGIAGAPPPASVPGVPLPSGSTGGDYPCSGERTLASQRTNLDSRLIFRNALSQPVQLFWLDYDGRRRPYLSLAPGETGVQPTFFTHPWVVADMSGRCLSIYYARRGDREVVVGP